METTFPAFDSRYTGRGMTRASGGLAQARSSGSKNIRQPKAEATTSTFGRHCGSLRSLGRLLPACHPDSTSPTLRQGPKAGGISTCTKQRSGTGKKSPLRHGLTPAETKEQLCPTPDLFHVATARTLPLEISPPVLHTMNNERWRRDDRTGENSKR